MDGEGYRKAVGWYTDEDDAMWDICKKHAKLVKEAGFKVNKAYIKPVLF